MSEKWYFVDDPLEYKFHKFKSMKCLVEFLEGPDFDGDPYDEVRVFEAVEIRPEVNNE